VVSFTHQLLYAQGKSPRYPLDRRLGGPRAVLDTVVKRKILSPAGNRTLEPRSSSPYFVKFSPHRKLFEIKVVKLKNESTFYDMNKCFVSNNFLRKAIGLFLDR
jgi:hypothetical protein